MAGTDGLVWRCTDSDIKELHLKRWPVQVELIVGAHRLRLANPEPLSSLIDALDDLYSIAVIDENALDAGHREFARFRVEFEDEDGPIATLHCDAFEVSASAA